MGVLHTDWYNKDEISITCISIKVPNYGVFISLMIDFTLTNDAGPGEMPTVAEPEGVRWYAQPPPPPVFKYPMKIK